MDIGHLLLDGRTRAGLSQRALAERAGTTQSVVARIEGGQSSPTWATGERLLHAAGFQLDAARSVGPGADTHMLDDVPRILALTPEARLQELGNFSRFVSAAQRV